MTDPADGTNWQAVVQPASPAQRKAVFGKAALFTVLGLWLIFMLTLTVGFLYGPFGTALGNIAGYGSFICGITLSIISLVKKERRVYAIVTLCLVVAGPALFMLVAMLFWFVYSLSL